MTTDHANLKPCPFCGSANIRVFHRLNASADSWDVICITCQNRTGDGDTRDEVMLAWNRRVEDMP